MFDTHYKEQLRLVDVLVDRIHALGGAGRVLAGTFLRSQQPYNAARGRLNIKRLLGDLLDAHESVLSTAQTGGNKGLPGDPTAVEDFAIGQVVLTNDHQGCSIQEQLVSVDQTRRFARTSFSSTDAYE